jgi:hypothetical protein
MLRTPGFAGRFSFGLGCLPGAKARRGSAPGAMRYWPGGKFVTFAQHWRSAPQGCALHGHKRRFPAINQEQSEMEDGHP